MNDSETRKVFSIVSCVISPFLITELKSHVWVAGGDLLFGLQGPEKGLVPARLMDEVTALNMLLPHQLPLILLSSWPSCKSVSLQNKY